MEALISQSIPGVRVTKIQTAGLQPRRFPDGDDFGLLGWPASRRLSSINR
ncbi:hypothetical protein D187_000470 [Cystobacter fuscus DSM 2262]|uniref:Uncharacterized protein n=2 Tax=Cystobacter fuscus TaxID=43 RepID=S9PLC4_CYSF2|nr:hypothetical protein D187_000470 [Cystobacter fuscus DSM 2262]